MKRLSLILCAIFVWVTAGANFRAPVYSVPRNRQKLRSEIADLATNGVFRAHSDSRLAQKIIQFGAEMQGWKDMDNVNKFGKKPIGVSPISNVAEWVYITEITVGTPPQAFRVILSISDSDIFIPSNHCDYSCDGHYKYQSNLSSTYVPIGTDVQRYYLRFGADGLVAQDTVQIGGIEMKNVTFAEAENINRFATKAAELGDENWDGILGLGPYANCKPQDSHCHNLDNPLLAMVSQGLLDKNMFGLKLSQSMEDPGEIMFGRSNTDLYDGGFKTMPLLNNTNKGSIRGRWDVLATSTSIGPGSASLEGFIASFDSDLPLIGLPVEFVIYLYYYLGMEQKGDTMGPYPIPFSIDCSRRPDLENFTLTLSGHEFVLTPYEYTIELDVEEWGGHRCISAIVPGSEAGGKYIAVGSAFLRAFYAVFDLDERTISLANLKKRPTR